MSDPFLTHLEKYGLLELHKTAQKVGYRVRTANSWEFALEYEGGLSRLYERDYAIKTFDMSSFGKRDALAFLRHIQETFLSKEP